jgi:CRP-like cAMP-binding protein
MGPIIGNAVVDALRHSELFGSLRPEDINTVAERCSTHRFRAGDRIFSRGDPGTTMYLVAQGAVALTVATADGGEITLAVLGPPQTFGELTLIDKRGRIASATARQPTQLLCIPEPVVARLIATKPDFALAMLTALARVIRTLDDHVADLVLLDLRGRVLKFLAKNIHGAASDHEQTDTPVPVHLQINQSELARLVGGSRQQVNRIIVDLERRKIIVRRGPRIVAVNPALLNAVMTSA